MADARLYVLVTECLCRASLVGTVSEALAGGAQIIQLREKNLPDRELFEKARAVRELTRKAGALFIVNDRPDLAVLAEADGVHLGQDDLPVRQVRRLLRPDALIGVSTHNLDQVQKAILEGASYIGVGPTFPSQTKAFGDFPGLDFVRQAAAETTLPAFVLGGITFENLPQVIAAGGRRIAVSQAICAAEAPKAITAKMRTLLDRAV
ncbi:MAG: thiamine phosphate synthase [Planctomycetes bacterium]|nr:thiamine phosphate synthase [Planctomycetota bacterium]